MERAGESLRHFPLAPAAEAGVRMGGTQIDLLSAEVELRRQTGGGDRRDFSRDNQSVDRDDDRPVVVDHKGKRFNPEIIMNARRGGAMPVAVPGQRQLSELAVLG